jgi:hypothetical protein
VTPDDVLRALVRDAREVARTSPPRTLAAVDREVAERFDEVGLAGC